MRLSLSCNVWDQGSICPRSRGSWQTSPHVFVCSQAFPQPSPLPPSCQCSSPPAPATIIQFYDYSYSYSNISSFFRVSSFISPAPSVKVFKQALNKMAAMWLHSPKSSDSWRLKLNKQTVMNNEQRLSERRTRQLEVFSTGPLVASPWGDPGLLHAVSCLGATHVHP